MLCEICKQDIFKNHFKLHIEKKHNYTQYNYYKEFIDKSFHKCDNPNCNNEAKFISIIKGYNRFCSSSCANRISTLERHKNEPLFNKEKQEQTKLERYGDKCNLHTEEIVNKIKKTCKLKYGVEHPMKNVSIIEKSKNTRNEKYGKYISDDSLTKMKLTNNLQYGCDNVFQNEIIKEKIKQTNLKRYGDEVVSRTDDIKDKIRLKLKYNAFNKIKETDDNIIDFNNGNLICKCDICNKEYEIDIHLYYLRKYYKTNPCIYCTPNKTCSSNSEITLLDFIKNNYSGNIIKNDRQILTGKELDIYIPEKKLAFEFDGLYWHNELYKEKNYHINKTNECEKQGIQLIHIFEDEWIYQNDIVKSRIKGLLGLNTRIYARKCQIKEVSYDDSKIFLEYNHIQGNCISKYRYGLYYNDELVSLMIFGKSRFNKDEFELLRFCNKLNTNVIGGASKLFKHFIREHSEITKIISFADRRWSIGRLYEKLEFNKVTVTEPSYFYVNGNIRENRLNYQKHKLIEEGFDMNLSEHEIMLSRKMYRIYDCGTIKFEFKKPTK